MLVVLCVIWESTSMLTPQVRATLPRPSKLASQHLTDPQRMAFPSSTCLADPYSCPHGQQVRLLQLHIFRYFWSSYCQVAVYPECHRLVCFLGDEVRAHNITALWSPLVTSFGAYPVLTMRSRVSLPSGHSTAIPSGEPSQDHRSHYPLSLEVGRQFVAASPVHPTSDHWRPRVSCGCH